MIFSQKGPLFTNINVKPFEFFRFTGSYFTYDVFYVPYTFMWPGTSGFVMVVVISQLLTKVTYGFRMVFFIYGPTLQLNLRTYILGWVSTSKTIFGHWTRFRCQKVRNTSPFTLLYSYWKVSAFAAHLLPHQACRSIFFLGDQHLESIWWKYLYFTRKGLLMLLMWFQ